MEWLYDLHPYVILLILICVDYVTGIIAAAIHENFSSTKMRQGLLHKLTYMLAIVLAYVIEALAAHYELGFVNGIVALVVVWIVITEVGSVIENLVKINPKLANNRFLAIFKNSNDDVEVDLHVD